jgi:hypothetical protein
MLTIRHRPARRRGDAGGARRRPFAMMVTAAAALVALGGAGAIAPAQAQDPSPDVAVDYPAGLAGQNASVGLPATMTFGFTGIDPDAGPTGGPPARFRYLFRRAEAPDQPHQYISDPFAYAPYVDELVGFADSLWTDWQPYPLDPAARRVTFPQQAQFDDEDNLIHYLFAVQVMDTTGVVSSGRGYGLQVANVHVSTTLAPLLAVSEPYLLHDEFSGTANLVVYDIVVDMELNFSWLATADHYGAAIAAYRWGWDLADPDDPNDPGWSLPPGLSPAHLQAPPQSFGSGVHTLTIRCWDDRDQLTQVVVRLDVVPIPDSDVQFPLLLVDDVLDRTSNAWPGEDGLPLDRDEYRDAFWMETLTGTGGVAGFDPARDVVDGEDADLDFRTMVNYRSTIWTSKRVAAPMSIVSRTFRPDPDDLQRYNWLAVYQQYAGNLLMVGSRNQEDFLRDAPYSVPLVLGAQTYPYRTVGFTLVDHFSPGYLICGTDTPGQLGRRPRCSGLKGLALDPDFAATYMPGGAAFADTILTDPDIDWQEPDPLLADLLGSLDYGWGKDEFYEANLSDCDIGVEPQQCPDGPCVEPMLRAMTRFGWIDQAHGEAGDDNWPATEYSPGELVDLCGSLAFADGFDLRAESVPIGYFVHKTKYDKPSQKADVVWGFDPYRFDNAQIRQAIRWVLGEHFGLVLLP